MAVATPQNQTAATASERMTAALIAFFLGTFLIFGAGLANSDVLHDTAHDSRHGYGFPCH